EVAEHSPPKPGCEAYDRTRIWRDIPTDRELHQVATGPMLRRPSALAGCWSRRSNRVEPLRTRRDGSFHRFGIVGRALDVGTCGFLEGRQHGHSIKHALADE